MSVCLSGNMCIDINVSIYLSLYIYIVNTYQKSSQSMSKKRSNTYSHLPFTGVSQAQVSSELLALLAPSAPTWGVQAAPASNAKIKKDVNQG